MKKLYNGQIYYFFYLNFSYLKIFLFCFSADTPFSQVKLGELPGWLARREKSPRAIAAAVSRGNIKSFHFIKLKHFISFFSPAFWAWQHKYHLPRKAGMAGHFQFIVATMTFFYIINYARIRKLFSF